MSVGDLVEVIDETSHWYHAKARIVDLTRVGLIVVELRGDRVIFDPHQLEVAEPIPTWPA